MNFRSDINGLRALAVLPVLFFHAGLPLFSGGFLGVDVFFVISGYLITEKLLSSFVSGRFSLAGFYDNRIRRIIPALLILCAFTTAASFIFMLPYSLKNYGQSLVATMLSANNILLYLTSGYWSLAAEFKPLYHTWSLGVEEQYYFIAPLLLYFIYRAFKKNGRGLRGCVLALLCVSFLVTVVPADNDKEMKFLLIFFRAWELLAGAWLALSSENNRSVVPLSMLGLAMLLCSYAAPFLLGGNQGVVEATPVIGTCLIIRFSNPDNLTGRILSLRPLAFIGLISYSIYLWHQPIIAFVRLSSPTQPHPFTLLAFSLLSLPLGYLSWRYVENVFRNRTLVSARTLYTIVGVGILVHLAAGYAFYRTYGLQSLWPEYSYGANPQTYVDWPGQFAESSFHNNGKPRILVIGNSFARDYINMLRETGHLDSMDVVLVDYDKGCNNGVFGRVTDLLKASDLVVFSQNWGQVAAAISVADVYSCYQQMRQQSGGRVVVLGAKNFGWNNDFVKLAKGPLKDIRVKPLDSVVAFDQSAKAILDKNYLDILDLVADKTGAVPVFTPDERFITYDTNHLTRAGARYVGEKLFARYGFLVAP